MPPENTLPTLDSYSHNLSRSGLIIYLGILLGSIALLGIYSRPIGSLAALWPANAYLLGIMIRNPGFRSPAGWLTAATALVAADLLTGSSLGKSLLLTVGNLIGVFAGVMFAAKFAPAYDASDQTLDVTLFGSLVLVSSVAAGLVGMIVSPLILNGTMFEGLIYWSVTELANYVTFLPLMLAAPGMLELRRLLAKFPALVVSNPSALLPGLSVVLLCLVATALDGPGAIAIPMLGLIWCGTTYGIFATSIFTLLFCIWAMVSLSVGYLTGNPALSQSGNLMSVRVSVSLVALIPIFLSSYIHSKNRETKALERSANIDSLTNVLNRRAFVRLLKECLTQTTARPAALLMIDLDYFKKINDKYGHHTGDLVLKHFVAVAKECLREQDRIGRLGGEEFAVLITQCDMDNVRTIAARIVESVARNPLETRDGEAVFFTLSIGVTFFDEADSDETDLLRRADMALYDAKSSGRNQVKFAG